MLGGYISIKGGGSNRTMNKSTKRERRAGKNFYFDNLTETIWKS